MACSTLAAYGECGSYDATEPGIITGGLKEIYRNKRDHTAKKCTTFEGETSKDCKILKEDITKNPMQSVSGQGQETEVTLQEKGRQQRPQQAFKKPPNLVARVFSSKNDNGSKEKDVTIPKDPASGSGRPRNCKGKETAMVKPHGDDKECQTTEQEPCQTATNARRRRQKSVNADQEYHPSIRNETVQPEVVPRCSKRLRRTPTVIGNEEPHPPPLKLPKLHVAVSRNEFVEDWFKITGQKYSGKPKKSNLVQLGLGLCTSLTCPSSIRYLKNIQ